VVEVVWVDVVGVGGMFGCWFVYYCIVWVFGLVCLFGDFGVLMCFLVLVGLWLSFGLVRFGGG